jgi:hypothetical protein
MRLASLMVAGCSIGLSLRGMIAGTSILLKEGGMLDRMMDRWYAYVLQLAGALVAVAGAFRAIEESDGGDFLQWAVGTLVVAAFFISMGKIAEDVGFIRDAVEKSQQQP